MKPLKLTLSGLKSFNEKATVDFKELIKGGLFGIFGDTGSGKSTLLDAIIYALYADFNKDHINKRSNFAYVDFTFEITYQNKRKTFEVERTFYPEKSSKSYLYDVTLDGKFCIAEKTKDVTDKIHEIIGLEKSEFEQCIVLPQGKFNKFISTTKTERVLIIENLFGLEKFGTKLKNAIDRKKLEIRDEKNLFEDRIKTLEIYTEESVNNKYQEVLNQEKLLETESKKINIIKEYIEKNESFYNDEIRLIEIDNLLKKYELEQDYFNEAKVVLNDLPLIKNIIDNSNEVKQISDKIVVTENDLKIKNDNLTKATANFESAKTNKENNLPKLKQQFDEVKLKIETFKTILDVYNEYNSDIEKLNNCLKEINDINVSIKNYDTKQSNLKNEISLLNEKLVSIDFNQVVSSVNEGVLREKIADEIKFLNKISLYDEFNNTTYIKPDVLNRLNQLNSSLSNYDKNENGFLSAISKFEEDNAKNEQVTKKINSLTSNLNEITQNIAVLTTKLDALSTTKNNLQKSIEDKNVKIKAVIGDNDITSYKSVLKSKYYELNSLITDIENDFDKRKDELNKAENNLSICQNTLNLLNENLNNATDKLTKSYFKNYTSVDVAKHVYFKYDNVSNLKIKTEKYFETVASLKNEMANKREKLKNSNYNRIEFISNKENFDVLSKNLSEINKNLGIFQNTYENFKQNFENKCIIEKEFESTLKREAVLDKLIKVTDRRRLLEFVADEYLKEITKIAKKTVTSLTSGKYSLDYDGEFLVIDNLNGGVKRSVGTLSGGESFIISLSLALALSQEIFSKSMRPIEFFFLDEGFGTLDKNLTEIVVSSLHKLKNDNFSIGLISHVPELVDAVDAKIYVTGQTHDHGSKIST